MRSTKVKLSVLVAFLVCGVCRLQAATTYYLNLTNSSSSHLEVRWRLSAGGSWNWINGGMGGHGINAFDSGSGPGQSYDFESHLGTTGGAVVATRTGSRGDPAVWLDMGSSNAPPVSYTWDQCMTNNSFYYADVTVVPDYRYTNAVPPVVKLDPGEYHCWSLTNGGPFSAHVHAEMYDDLTPRFSGDGPELDAHTNGVPNDPIFTGGHLEPLPGPDGDGNATGNDIGVLSTNIQISIYGLGLSLGRGLGELKTLLEDANAKLERIRTNTIPGTNGTGLDYTGVLNEIKTNTGLSAARLGTMTNDNSSSASNNMPVTAWTMAGAVGAGSNAMSGWSVGIDNVVSNIGSAPIVNDQVKPEDALQVPFVDDIILDFDPEVQFPGLMGAIKACVTFLLLLGFCQWAGREMWELVKVFSSAQTGGVPDLAVGGFNVGSVAIVAIVAVALIAGWVGVGVWLSGQFLEQTGLLPNAGSDFGNKVTAGNMTALYLLTSVFPVTLACSLAFTRATLPFLLSKIVGVACAASRFLIGK